MHLAIKRAGAVVLSTGALCVAAAPAQAADPVTLGTGETASWAGSGSGLLTGFDSALGCDATPAQYCERTVVNVAPRGEDETAGPRTLTLTLTPTYEDNDFDFFIYPDADGDGEADGEALDGGALGFVGETETVVIPDAVGSYLVDVAYFFVLGGEYSASAALADGAPASPEARRSAGSYHASQLTAVANAVTSARK